MWKLIVCAVLWIGTVFLLNSPQKAGDITLPAMGKFFYPGSGFWQNAERAGEPGIIINKSLQGLNGQVEISFDERMVPHIFAESEMDAWFAQGYVTAMNRLWQIDISTRAAAGELSAILGPGLIGFDKRQREQGIRWAAENAVRGWSKNGGSLDIVEAYTAGVNAWIASLRPKHYPVEYKLMGFEPEPWSVLKTALFVKSMASRLSLAEDDLENSNLLAWLGKERFETLFPRINPVDDPIIPSGTPWNFDVGNTYSDTVSTIDVYGSVPSEQSEERLEGSNNWAVSGSKTLTGDPILCNDPHLGLSLPSVWYELQLTAPGLNVYGCSLPGIPGVIIGFNKDIAWGMTNCGYDVVDWYNIKWTDETKSAYWLDGKEVPVEYRIEEIAVKGGATVTDTVRYTVWGPVQNNGPHAGLAMRWLAHLEPDSDETSVFPSLCKAKSHAEFKAALEKFITPASNFVFASTNGDVAMEIGGYIPLRKNPSGRFVQDGSRSENGWHGRVPAAHNPSVLNPVRGFVSSANQTTTDTTYPYLYLGKFEDFRGNILNRYLGKMKNVSIKEMMFLQNNTISLKAEGLVPELLTAVKPETEEQKTLLKELRLWHFDYETDAKSPVFFELWYSAFIEFLWDDFEVYADSVYIRKPEAWRTNLLARTNKQSQEFDYDSLPGVETFEEIAQLSFLKAYNAFTTLEAEKQTWGGYRQTTIRHLANIPAFSKVISTPGHKDALNAVSETHGPSWRMVVQLSDPLEAYVVYPGGQSGNPGSPYYAQMISSWQAGEYYTAHFIDSPDALPDDALVRLTLSPE